MTTSRHSSRGRLLGVALLAAALGLTGCDLGNLLQVEDPEYLDPSTLDDPAVLGVVVTGAIGDFTRAYSGAGGDAFLSVTGVMSDELFSSGTFTTRTATDRRNQFTPADGNTSDNMYNMLHKARRALGLAADKVAEFEGTSDARFAELKSLEGFTYVALGEAFCSAVPISTGEANSPSYGEPKTYAELFADAVAIFDEALASGSSELAAVGKGRALLNRGEFAAAAAAVAGVPTGFNYFLRHSVSGARNPIYALQGNGRYSVSDTEGINGLPFRSADDPRAPWWRDPSQQNGFDANYPLYKTLRYTDYTSPVVLASGVEARLIEAEAALQASDYTTWLAKLNELRTDFYALMEAQVPGYGESVNQDSVTLAPLVDPGNDVDRQDLMFSERGFWMYLTGHRLGDLRRMVRQYGRAENTVYPTGDYHKGGSYGTDVVFPLDFDEANNPNFSHDSCDVGSAG